jgi:hypothetical protein
MASRRNGFGCKENFVIVPNVSMALGASNVRSEVDFESSSA